MSAAGHPAQGRPLQGIVPGLSSPRGHVAGVHREGPLSAIKSVLEIVIVAIFVTTFIAQPFRIPSSSMVPTLRVGDFVLVDKESFAPGVRETAGTALSPMPPADVHRGDIVVFYWPVDPSKDLVKRVVGLPGDRIRLRGGRVFIDEQPLAEPYALYTPSRRNSFRDEFPSLREADPNVEPRWWLDLRRTIEHGEITVPPDSYFVLGDNRNDSEDSRYWGFVPRAAILGRALAVYFAVNPYPNLDASPAQRLRAALHYGLTSIRVLR